MKRIVKLSVGLTLLVAVACAGLIAARPVAQAATEPAPDLPDAERPEDYLPGTQCQFRLRVANAENREMSVPAGEPAIVIVAPEVGGELWIKDEFVRASVTVARFVGERHEAEPEFVDYYTSDLEGIHVPAGTISDEVDAISFNLDPGDYVAWACLHSEGSTIRNRGLVDAAQDDLGPVVSLRTFYITVE